MVRATWLLLLLPLSCAVRGPDDDLASTYVAPTPPAAPRSLQTIVLPRATTLRATRLAVTTRNEVVVAGAFTGDLEVDGRTIAGSAFVAAYDFAGSFRWVFVWSGLPLDMAADGEGDVHVVGMAGPEKVHDLDDPTRGSALVMRLADGKLVASDRYGVSERARAYKLAVSPDGTRHVAFTASAEFSLNGVVYPKIEFEGQHVLAELPADGSIVTARAMTGRIGAMAADQDGLSVAAHGPATMIRYAPDTGEVEAALWLTRRLGSGHEWQRLLPAEASAMAIDARGNAILAGSHRGTIVIGPSTLRNVDPRYWAQHGPCGTNALVAEFSPSGQPQWARAFGRGPVDDDFASVAIARDGAVWLAGTEGASCGWTSADPGKPLLISLDPDGTRLESHDTGVALGNGTAVATANDGSVFALVDNKKHESSLVRLLPRSAP